MPARTTAAQTVTPRATTSMSNERKAFWHSPYTNADAQVVKQKKNLPSLDAAKEFIGSAIINKKEADLQKIGVTRYRFDDQDCLTRFARSGFTDSDVKQAKKSFDFLKGASTTEVKGYLGLKLRNAEVGYKGGLEMLQQNGITESKYDNHELMDAFKSSGMGDRQVRDAKAKYDFLAGSSPTEIKQYLGLKVLNAKDGSDFAKDFLKNIGASKGWGR
ncbi:MAG: hypothetical protein JNM69_15865 [Archangium sp.]|nr:hypothetical protein [Archangium sp.]